ncbi:MAG: ABC transporter ATP-binding protein [Firmicutes bacterium HGW-Firmicutes-7]|nr:MAG: ABC transporter ATP-binding protein [Firmicutes bacterium HGW-Firmicutes-7]
MGYIIFEGINKYFGTNHVLKNIHLEINQGDFVTLLGSSGCGKSTLLRCLAGLETISSGRIFLDGEDITEKNPKDRNVGMIFQQYSLFPNMSAFDNIAFGLKMKKMAKDEIEERVYKAIKMVELVGKEKQVPAQLSGGQQQRVALARAIVAEPKVLLLDEPLSAIDAKLRRSLQARIREIHKELKITSIFVTHDQDEAMIMSDVIHLFNNGTIEQSDKPIDLYTAPKTPFAAGFIGHYNILTKEVFSKMIHKDFEGTYDIAIRPETIELSSIPHEVDNQAYQFIATIKDHTLHGNVLRYTLFVNDIEFKADVLFRSFKLFHHGKPVYVSIEKHNCLIL